MVDHKIKFSCADFTFPLLSHQNSLRLIKILGFDYVDLGMFEGRSHIYPSQIMKNPTSEGKSLKRMLNNEGLEASDVFLQTGADPPINAANNPEDGIRNKNRTIFLKMLEFANVLGCQHITGLPGVWHKGESKNKDWYRAVEEANWRTAEAKKAGIVYGVEPHVGSILSDVVTSQKFLKECPGLTLTLDYGHFIYQGLQNEEVHPLISSASHFHARGGAEGRLQTILKENIIDFDEIIRVFKNNEYEGFVCIEYVYQDWEGCNKTDNVSETICLLEMLKKLSIE